MKLEDRVLDKAKSVHVRKNELRYLKPKEWQRDGSVPLSQIYRAKGNEAARVYACRFEFAHQAVGDKTEVQARNGALVAMTRARFWLTISSGGPAPVLEEIQRAKAQYPLLEFQSFTQRTLERVLEIADDDLEGQLPLPFQTSGNSQPN